MAYAEEYKKKSVTPEEAVKVVKSGDWIEYGFGHTKPIALDKALAARKDELKDINIRNTLTLIPASLHRSRPGRRSIHAARLALFRLCPQTARPRQGLLPPDDFPQPASFLQKEHSEC